MKQPSAGEGSIYRGHGGQDPAVIWVENQQEIMTCNLWRQPLSFGFGASLSIHSGSTTVYRPAVWHDMRFFHTVVCGGLDVVVDKSTLSWKRCSQS